MMSPYLMSPYLYMPLFMSPYLCPLIGEGFDCSGLSTLFLTTPITFEGRLLQIIGRIMRPAAGKQAQVYDYVDDSVSVLRRSAESRRKILAAL